MSESEQEIIIDDNQKIENYVDFSIHPSEGANGFDTNSNVNNTSSDLNVSEQQRILPVVDPTTGIYTDENGEQWGSKKAIGQSRLALFKKNASSEIRAMNGMSRGHPAILYNIADINAFEDTRKQLPVADQQGIYIDEEGKAWGGARHFGHKDIEYLRRSELPTIRGISNGGTESRLYPIDEATEVLAQRKDQKPKGYMKDERNIKNELERVLREHGHAEIPDQPKFIEWGESGVYQAMSKNGGIPYWREKLGHELRELPKGYFKDEANIESRLRSLIDRLGLDYFPTTLQLVNNKESSLAQALVDGKGLPYWRQKMGFPEGRKERGFWSPDTIRRKAIEFVTKHGNLDSGTLKEFGGMSLHSAILRNYPGGLERLMADIEEMKNVFQVSPDDADEMMRDFEIE